jgi:hypothetical protein
MDNTEILATLSLLKHQSMIPNSSGLAGSIKCSIEIVPHCFFLHAVDGIMVLVQGEKRF